jgi:quercetin dioxygenase-like cupin family protein
MEQDWCRHAIAACDSVDLNHTKSVTEKECRMPGCKRLIAMVPFFFLFGAWLLAGTIVATAQQPMPSTVVTALMKQGLSDLAGREATMITLDIPPGGGSPPHRHPGAHIFGYVLEGAYRIKVDHGPETVLTRGQTFYEAPGQLHAVSRNASETAPAKVLVVVIGEIGKPATVPENP